MKKRITAMALAGILAVSVLAAGCGRNAEEDADTPKKAETQVDGTEKTEDKNRENVVKPREKTDSSTKGEKEDTFTKSEEDADDESDSGTSGQQEYKSEEETSDRKENADSEDNTDGTDDMDDNAEEPAEVQTVTGIIQDISGSTLGIMEADGGVYGFDTGILSGFDDSYHIGDTVTITYEGDTMNPDNAEISH